jgi:hypothetical protein
MDARGNLTRALGAAAPRGLPTSAGNCSAAPGLAASAPWAAHLVPPLPRLAPALARAAAALPPPPPWLLAAAALAAAALLAVAAARGLRALAQWARVAAACARLPHPPEAHPLLGALSAMARPSRPRSGRPRC